MSDGVNEFCRGATENKCNRLFEGHPRVLVFLTLLLLLLFLVSRTVWMCGVQVFSAASTRGISAGGSETEGLYWSRENLRLAELSRWSEWTFLKGHSTDFHINLY